MGSDKVQPADSEWRTTVLVAIADLREYVSPSAPLDAEALQARGYTRDEAYALLRTHGVRIPGGRRRRISPSVLGRIERGEVPA